jgi:hypothetical protein
MSLDVGKLEDEFRKMFDAEHADFVGWPPTKPDAAANWSDAYDLFASDAEDVSTDPVTVKNPSLFESTLAAALPGPDGTAVDAAQAFDDAFVQYWTGGVFAVGTPPPSGVGGTGVFSVELTSVVTVVAPNVLKGLLVPIFESLSSDPDQKAEDIAAAFETATKTAVTVLISGLDTTPPPSGPLPITNTDFVY